MSDYWQDKFERNLPSEEELSQRFQGTYDNKKDGKEIENNGDVTVTKKPSFAAQFFLDIAKKQDIQGLHSAPVVVPVRPSEADGRVWRQSRDLVVPLLYGKRRIEGIPLPVGTHGAYLYVVYIFCEGEIESFESYYIDGQEASNFSGLYAFTEYLGTTSQAYDSTLHSIESDWEDPLTSTAYVVARWKADEKFNSVPRLAAVIKGRKVYDHRTDTTYYSTNPILCDVDRQRSARYGEGTASSAIDWNSVDTAADVCDEQVNSEDRYSLNYVLLKPTSQDQVSKFILAHCNGEKVFSEGKWHWYVHQARSSVATFTQDEMWNVTLGRPPQRTVFNRVRCAYLHQDDWREDEYSLETSELIAGDEPESVAHFDFTGCSSLSQVHRLAVYQLNRRASDLSLTFQTYNTKGLQRYDRFQVTHSTFGLSSQDFYCLSVDGDKVTATEYTTDLFSEEVVATPTLPEADLPLPTDTPDEVTELELTEDVVQTRDGHFVSVIKAAWTASVFPWVSRYEGWIKQGSNDYVLYGTTTGTAMNLVVPEELKTYTVKIVTVSRWDVSSSGEEQSIYIQGKNWVPTWPTGATLSGTEAGDVAILSWDAAVDDDTVRYEVRRSRTTDTWETAEVVATIDALNYFDRTAPAGTWRYYVKAIDSVGQYTTTALHVDVEVTVNPNLAFNKTQTVDLDGSTVNLIAVSPSGTDNDIAFPIASAHTWGDKFTAGTTWASQMTAGDPWAEPVPTSGTMDLVTAKVDMGNQFTGEFTLNYTATKFGSGSATLTPYLLLSEDDSTYTSHAASSSFTATARYIKAKFVWTNGDSSSFYAVGEPVTVTIKANPVIDSGTATVSSSGSLSITFNMTFAAVDRIQLTPKGSSARVALADNVNLTGFDLKLFNTSGSAASGDVYWKAEGV